MKTQDKEKMIKDFMEVYREYLRISDLQLTAKECFELANQEYPLPVDMYDIVYMKCVL